ncbi:uncharacterized protein TOT_030000604 [Theileria orientalis strain Shintoku]|uniref:Uncharacterized protein n=1 Tax=Theileria orientalis strain Shintoku TaxID=869250 RepID=J4CDL3_THEOR|nr:uncharacterized protein TOT_030000604 [Theileria orientalis strain Shintoku]BAM41342.1 uncharacterized protein TOT_030000604 [Theileria orientalis strain Shintoku]|eukprot:XP_009691643.1 uncharacterized protein TOT_030000604 [Theileria orientalis strain Shintoku]
MFRCLLRRTFSCTVNLETPSTINNQKNSKKNFLDAINLTMPVLGMKKQQVEAELKSLGEELRSCGMYPETEKFVKAGLQDFRLNLVKSVLSDSAKINQMSQYILQTPSKLFRPSLSLLTHRLLQPSNNDIRRLIELCKSYELIHIGTLIHDDILDDSAMRRKAETLHLKFQIKSSVLVGDFLLAKSAKIAASLDSVSVIQRLSETLKDLIEGEMFNVDLSEDMCKDYFKKIYMKTASLIANNMASVPIIYTVDMDDGLVDLFHLIGVHIGMAFQICDDLLDYTSTVDDAGKPLLSDLKSGLFTLPLICTIYKDNTMNRSIINLVKDGSYGEVLKIMNNNDEYINQCKLSIYYHLYQIKLLLKEFDPIHYHSLINYVYNVVDRS